MIYICIAAHNEEQTVGVVLWKIRQVMAEFPRDYQLLVVDDASTDKTPDVLAPYARVLPLTVVRTDRRRGQAAAVEMMLREAVRRSEYPKRDVVITLQADFTQEPDELVGLIKRMEAGADVAVGQPQPDPSAPAALRWGRRLARRLLGSGRVPEGVSDPFMGYAAFRIFTIRRALEEAAGRLVHWGGWAGAAELLAAAAPHARRVDVLDMIERRERLQRPSRLRVWPAVREVWALARGSRPSDLQSPDELDQAMRAVAARRTSELALTPRERTQRQERSEGTQRTARRRGKTEERGRDRQPREPARSEPRARGENGSRSGERTARRRNGRAAGAAAAPRPQAAGLVTGPGVVAPEAMAPETVEGPAGPPRAKRSRRRKRPARPAAETPLNGAAAAAELAASTTDLAAGHAERSGQEEADAGARSRRRRRGRRGGRRRSGASGASGVAAESAAEPSPATGEVPTPVPEAFEEGMQHD
ncbi:MAG TPA: glycosyltransferase family 2 protein [Longimicrobiales bacterium]|nr:glycosyltransferase family 2 protein [Longimicrobiales bacterium]